MDRTFYNPTNIEQLRAILDQLINNCHNLYFSNNQGNVFVIKKVDPTRDSISYIHIGTDPEKVLTIAWESFKKNAVHIWGSDI